MNWDMTDEEKLLKQSATEFFRENLPIRHLRAMRDSQDQLGFRRELWLEMAELGWTGILIPEEFGGLNFGFRGLGLVMEAAGRQLSNSPLLSTVACAGHLIQNIGTADQQSALLPQIAAGKLILAVAHDEGHKHSRGVLQTTVAANAGGFILDGKKSLVLDAQLADKMLVLARDAGDTSQLSWFLVDRQTPGVEFTSLRLVDSRPVCQVNFKKVQLPKTALLGMQGQAAASYQQMLDAGTISLAAEMLGSATSAFEMTLDYLKERKQFGVAVGSFQALQHRMAMLYSELEVSKAIVQRGLAALDEGSAEVSMLASLAKAKLSDLFKQVACESIQLHGGIGMTDEHDIGFFLKRSHLTAELFGNAGFHRDRYAGLLEF